MQNADVQSVMALSPLFSGTYRVRSLARSFHDRCPSPLDKRPYELDI